MKTKKTHNSTTKHGNIKKKLDDGVPKGLKASKQEKYINWFQLDLWPPIMVAIKNTMVIDLKLCIFFKLLTKNQDVQMFTKH